MWVPRWAFGEDRFGEGGFGYDGASAPGLGLGAFGAGEFGMDADLIELDVALEPEGTHTIVLRTRSRDGQFSDSPAQYVNASLPPVPAAALTADAYDPQAQQLTLTVS